MPKWAVGWLVAMVPVGSYSWMLYKQPDIRRQIEDEVRGGRFRRLGMQ